MSCPPAAVRVHRRGRLLTLRAQGLLGADSRRGGVPAMLRRLGAVQLDTISVAARSHELVAYARPGPVPRARIERAYWNPRQPAAFEYWSRAACILPLEEWPSYAFPAARCGPGQALASSHERTCAGGAGPAARRGAAERHQPAGQGGGPGGTGRKRRSPWNGCWMWAR